MESCWPSARHLVSAQQTEASVVVVIIILLLLLLLFCCRCCYLPPHSVLAKVSGDIPTEMFGPLRAEASFVSYLWAQLSEESGQPLREMHQMGKDLRWAFFSPLAALFHGS